MNDLAHQLTAAAGGRLAALPQIIQASFLQKMRAAAPDGWQLRTHFEIVRGVPVKITLTDARNRGDSNEKNVRRRSLEPGRCYVAGRGYEQIALFNAIVDAGSSYVCRIRNDHFENFTAEEIRPLSDEALDAGVLQDAVNEFQNWFSRRGGWGAAIC